MNRCFTLSKGLTDTPMQKSLPDDRASHSEYAVKAEKQPRTEPTLYFSIFYAVFAPFIVSNTLRYLTCETRM